MEDRQKETILKDWNFLETATGCFGVSVYAENVSVQAEGAKF